MGNEYLMYIKEIGNERVQNIIINRDFNGGVDE
jgi:hypothetical protein